MGSVSREDHEAIVVELQSRIEALEKEVAAWKLAAYDPWEDAAAARAAEREP